MFNELIATAAVLTLTASPMLAPTAAPEPLVAYTYEQALIECNTLADDLIKACRKAAHDTPWAPASTTFVTYTLANNPDIVQTIAAADRDLRDTAIEFDTTYEYERDILVCEQAFPTMYEADDARYSLDPTADALDACINDTIMTHRMFG